MHNTRTTRTVAALAALAFVALAAAPVASASAIDNADQNEQGSMEVCVPFTTICFYKTCIIATSICIFCGGSEPCTIEAE